MKALVKKRSGSLRHIVILLVAAFMVVFQSLTFLTSFLPISSAACWATPGWTSSSWGGSSGGRRRARWSAGTQGSSKFLAEIWTRKWTRLNCRHRSFLSIGQIFSLFLVLPLLLRSAFTFYLYSILCIPYYTTIFYITFYVYSIFCIPYYTTIFYITSYVYSIFCIPYKIKGF